MNLVSLAPLLFPGGGNSDSGSSSGSSVGSTLGSHRGCSVSSTILAARWHSGGLVQPIRVRSEYLVHRQYAESRWSLGHSSFARSSISPICFILWEPFMQVSLDAAR